MRAALLKILLHLFALLPLRLNQRCGAALGWLLYRLPNTLRTVSRINLQLCLPQLDTAHRERLLRHNLAEVGKSMCETGPLWLWDTQRVLSLISAVSGEEELRAALGSGHGVVLAVPHLGCWELVGIYCSAHYPMVSMYRPPRMPQLDSVIRRGRERAGARLVPTDTRGVRALYHALAQGHVCALLPDQEPARGTGLFVRFFDQPAYTMVLAARLALKTDATIVFAWAERLAAGAGFHLHFRSLETAGSDIEAVTQAINDGIEQWVRACPQQYQWGYKRFRSRPDDGPSPYDG